MFLLCSPFGFCHLNVIQNHSVLYQDMLFVCLLYFITFPLLHLCSLRVMGVFHFIAAHPYWNTFILPTPIEPLSLFITCATIALNIKVYQINSYLVWSRRNILLLNESKKILLSFHEYHSVLLSICLCLTWISSF